jgi:hypothetical protein
MGLRSIPGRVGEFTVYQGFAPRVPNVYVPAVEEAPRLTDVLWFKGRKARVGDTPPP